MGVLRNYFCKAALANIDDKILDKSSFDEKGIMGLSFHRGQILNRIEDYERHQAMKIICLRRLNNRPKERLNQVCRPRASVRA